jgi:hypothetical protein
LIINNFVSAKKLFPINYHPVIFNTSSQNSKCSPPGFKANAAFFSADIPVNRARVPGRANGDVEKIIGITPELFTCSVKP